MFGTVNGYGVDVARQRIEELHRDADRYRLVRGARRRRARRRKVLRGWLRPAPARSAAAR
jgi:hypothetical protein